MPTASNDEVAMILDAEVLNTISHIGVAALKST